MALVIRTRQTVLRIARNAIPAGGSGGGLTQAEADDLYDPLGAADGVAVTGAAALAAHVAAADPHPGYLTEAAAATTYEPAGTAAAAVAAHVGLPDPHPEYLTAAEGAAAYTAAPSQTTITPGTTQTDLDLTGFTDVRIVPTASCMCVSIVAEAAGTTKTLRNLGTYPFLLVMQSPLGTASNRLQSEDVGSGTHCMMLPGDVVRLLRDGTDARWTVIPWRDVGHRWTMRQWLPSTSSSITANTLPFSGTASNTAVPVTSGSYLESRWRMRLTTTAVSTSIVTVNAAAGTARSLLGNGAGLGGFAVRVGFGNETEPDDLATAAIGFTSDTSVGVGNDFDLLTDFVGFELNPGDANWHWMSNNNTGTATRDDLGAGFPRTAGVWLRGWIYADPFVSGRVSYAVWREDDVTVTPVMGDDTTDLPTTAMGGLCHVCNRTSALIHTFSFDEVSNWTPT